MKVFNRLRNILKQKRAQSGEISFSINMEFPGEISFRISAMEAYVDWGDGHKSEIITITELFRHSYMEAGVYHLNVYGKDIIDIELKECNITELDVSKCSTLEFIDCSYNLLTELDISNCKWLYELYCGKNHLQELKLGEYDKLFYISCSCNYLEKIEIKGCKNLVNLRCRHNRLRSLDVSPCKKLVSINIENNLFDFENIMKFLLTLPARPQNDVGFVILHDNLSGEYDQAAIKKLISLKGWREI